VLSVKQGELWPRVVACTEAALRSGALVSIDTEGVTVEDGGVPFFVRVAQKSFPFSRSSTESGRQAVVPRRK
jgi:ATP adenylyltransferase/5',5'''-P-1,P-4-tetraphosphate phosphorylase II